MIENLPDWPIFGLVEDVRLALAQAVAAGEPIALATIVALDGGGPRPVGTQMAVTPTRVAGFLSGGCLEGDVVAHAPEVIGGGAPKRLVYGEGSPWPDIRLLCGARVDVLLERLSADDPALATLLRLTGARQPAAWVSDGARRACGPADRPPEAWPGAFSRTYQPAPRLVVLGSDPSALAIADLGARSGFETTLVRPRGPLAPPPLQGVAYRRDAPDVALAAIGIDAWTAVAVATHDAELDHAALAQALPSEAFYVGALGARRRVGDRKALLAAAGLNAATVARLHTPIGLDIGGKAPWEVAVAVIAQITAERHRLRLA